MVIRNRKTSQGRKKIPMRKIESDDARQVCFSKRKKGVFAKACELSTMCGAEVALLMHSPVGTPYTFGSPSVDKVFKKFMGGEDALDPVDQNFDSNVYQLNQDYVELTELLEAAETKREVLVERIEQAASLAKECDWVDRIDELNRDELLQLLGSMYRTKCSLNDRIYALSRQGGVGSSNVGASSSRMDQKDASPPNS